jgi:hypothetical protein
LENLDGKQKPYKMERHTLINYGGEKKNSKIEKEIDSLSLSLSTDRHISGFLFRIFFYLMQIISPFNAIGIFFVRVCIVKLTRMVV